MEKSFKFKLTDAQKKEVADALGISIDQVGVQVAYGQAIDEDAKGNDAVIATVGEKADDGKVWVVEQLAMAAQRPDGSNLVLDTSSVAGGLEASSAMAAKLGPADDKRIKLNPQPQQYVLGEKKGAR